MNNSRCDPKKLKFAYVFMNGGNGSMDTVEKFTMHAKKKNMT